MAELDNPAMAKASQFTDGNHWPHESKEGPNLIDNEHFLDEGQ